MSIQEPKKGLIKLFIAIICLIFILIFSLMIFKSIWITVSISIGYIYISVYSLTRTIRGFRKVVREFYNEGLEFYPDRPIYTKQSSEWLIGTGYTGVFSYPVWVKTNERGIVCFFRCYPFKNPLIIDWEKIERIEPKEFYHHSSKKKLAKVFLTFKPYSICIPWRRSFLKAVPNGVGVQEVKIWSKDT